MLGEIFIFHYYAFVLYGLFSETLHDASGHLELSIEIYSECYIDIQKRTAAAIVGMITFNDEKSQTNSVFEILSNHFTTIRVLETEFSSISKDKLTLKLAEMNLL